MFHRPSPSMRALYVAAAILTLSAGCGPHDNGLSHALPELDPESFAQEVRGTLQQRLERAQSHPRDASAAGELGMLLHAVKRYGAAVQCYERAKEIAPDSFEWTYYLADALTQQGQHEKAVETLLQVRRIRPEYVPAQLRLAENLLDLSRFQESRKIYEAVLADIPYVATAFYGLGRAQAGLGQAPEALASFQKACELAPEAGAAHYALALAYRDAGESEKARRHLDVYQRGNHSPPPVSDPMMDRVLELAKDHHWYLNEGRRLDSAGRRQEAIRSYEQALTISPDFYQAHVNLLGSYSMLGNADKAYEHYRRAADINPNIPELHYNWGVFQASQQRFQEAERAFRKALDLNPQFADAHQNLGTTLERLGRPEEAVQHYRAALQNDPNQRVAQFHLGRLEVEQGYVTEGITHLKQALNQEDLRSSYIHYALAMAYARLDDPVNATAHARKALEMARKYGQHDFARSIEPDLQALEGSLKALE